VSAEVVRCDAATVSGHHEVTEDGMSQFGRSRDGPALPQIRMMTAPDPPGMPPATDIVSGEKADDPALHEGGKVLCDKDGNAETAIL